MFHGKGKVLLGILFLVVTPNLIFCQQRSNENNNNDDITEKIRMLRKYFGGDENWHTVNPVLENEVSGLLNFLEDEPVGNILDNLSDFQKDTVSYVDRLPGEVKDSLKVPGYISAAEAGNEKERIKKAYRRDVKKEDLVVPGYVTERAKKRVKLIPEGKGLQLFADSVYIFPDSLVIPDVIPDSVLNSPDQFDRLVRIDEQRKAYVEKKRVVYNDSLLASYVNTAVTRYREQKYDEGLAFRIKRYSDSIKRNNLQVLNDHNNEVVSRVNDTISMVLRDLIAYADNVDTARVSVVNITGGRQDILLRNGRPNFSRVWLKNRQNDSLRVMMKSLDKRSVEMLIDDGVTFSRFKEKQKKDFDFASLRKDYNKFNKLDDRYEVETPWEIEGEGNLGFTQTHLDNWASGGQNSITLLLGFDGSANYTSSDKKIKWENSIDIDNAWLKPGKWDSVWQKSTDNVKIVSRFGLSAAKNNKWYYSVELNFNTQFFKGYKYPRSEYPDPISAFLAPAKTYFKLGMDYKPKDDLSVFVSPLSLKNVFVRDTSLIDQTDFGVDEGRKAFWEPGLNAEINFKTNLTPTITYDTDYTMFINYKDPFRKFDIDWENTFKMKLNNYITMQFMLHFVYDDDVTFSVYDSDGNEIGEETKWQIKEYFSLGFSYTISRDIKRTHRIH